MCYCFMFMKKSNLNSEIDSKIQNVVNGLSR